MITEQRLFYVLLAAIAMLGTAILIAGITIVIQSL